MIRSNISPELSILDKLHEKNYWIPNSHQIRPNEFKIEEKTKLLVLISYMYHSYEDYIYEFIFGFKTQIKNNKLFVPKTNIIKKSVFIENYFPYQIPKNCNHYVLWYSFNPDSDSEINNKINFHLEEMLNHNNYNFIWYVNPKKTISNSYHYQVFWIDLNKIK